MSNVIAVMGESGSGKTTSLRTLDPKHTFIIDADRKGLSWKGWKGQYNAEYKNYEKISDVNKIRSILWNINEKAEHISTVVIDTINSIMIDDEMQRRKEKGYDKWQDFAYSVYSLVSEVHFYRDNLNIIFLAHSQTERDESGYSFSKIKTSGKKLDKIVLESKFSTVLFAKCKDGEHVFETKSKNSTAKSPLGMFEVDTIPNDMAEIIKKLEEF